YTLWNVGVSYKWKSGSRFDQSVRLNVNNVFDKDYLKVSKIVGDGRGIFLSYTLSFAGFSGLMSH
ncbi:MAG: hypothetical protein ABUL65_03475, partial [Opitutus sp.]